MYYFDKPSSSPLKGGGLIKQHLFKNRIRGILTFSILQAKCINREKHYLVPYFILYLSYCCVLTGKFSFFKKDTFPVFCQTSQIYIYLKLYSVCGSNTRKLVRSKILGIFKHNYRWVFATAAVGPHQGVLESTQTVLKLLKVHKDEVALVKACMLPTRTTGTGT